MDENRNEIIISERKFDVNGGKILHTDEKEYGNFHEYEVTIPLLGDDGEDKGYQTSYISFQKGPVKEVGVNGITERDLIEILIDRLDNFVNSDMRDGYTESALDNLRKAATALDSRTRDRLSRNVEGTSEV